MACYHYEYDHQTEIISIKIETMCHYNSVKQVYNNITK